jgi:hypothetical protein
MDVAFSWKKRAASGILILTSRIPASRPVSRRRPLRGNHHTMRFLSPPDSHEIISLLSVIR